jgi:hypothetical protein
MPKNLNALYKLVHDTDSKVNAVGEELTLDMLHQHLGHITPAAARKLVHDGIVSGLKLDSDGPSDFFCESCTYAKATKLPIAKERSGEGAKSFGKEVYSDVWGPATTATQKGWQFYITFTDNFSCWTHIEFLEKKSNTFNAYKNYEAWCETQFNACLKVLHSDRGGEYTSTDFQVHLKPCGTEQ